MKESLRFHPRWPIRFGLIVFAAAAQAQTPLALPDIPVGSSGVVSAIARQADGSLIVGGSFTRIDGVPRSSLARLHADGTLDEDWKPSVKGVVWAIAVDAAGDVIVAGRFSEADGLPRNSIAKIAGQGSGGVDALWNPVLHAPAGVRALAVGAGGDVFAAGDLIVDGVGDRRVVKIAVDGAGAVDAAWNPAVGHDVIALAADTGGSLYVAVYGTGVDCCLAKISASGHGDAVAGWHTAFDGLPWAMAFGADGALYAGAALPFDFGGDVRHYLVRFAPGSHGEIDPDWLPEYTQWVTALAVDGNAIYASLDVDGTHDASVVKLTSASGAATQWQTTGRGVNALAIGADHSLYAGGDFEALGGVAPGDQPKLSFARLDATNGHALPAVDAILPGTINAIAMQPDGGAIVGGHFSRAGTKARKNLLRVNADGELDPAWNPSFDAYAVLAIVVDVQNTVFVGGYDVSPTRPAPILKLAGDGDGDGDPHWHVSTDGSVATLAADASGSLYVGGDFSTIAGVTREDVAKLSTSTATVDAVWNASTIDPVQSIVVDDAHSAVYVGSGSVRYGFPGSGVGTVYAGVISKLSSTTGSDAGGWSRSVVGIPYAIALAPDASLFAGGHFVSGTDVSDVLKLTPAGSPDAAWNAATPSDDNPSAFALFVDADGDVYTGGYHQIPSEDGSGFGPYLLKRARANGSVVADWAPAIEGAVVHALVRASQDTIDVGGYFSMIAGEPRDSLAAIAIAATTPEDPTHGHSQHARPDVFVPPLIPSPTRLRPSRTASAGIP